MLKDRPAFIEFVNAVQSEDFDRIIAAHGDIIEDNPRATFVRLCEWFNHP